MQNGNKMQNRRLIYSTPVAIMSLILLGMISAVSAEADKPGSWRQAERFSHVEGPMRERVDGLELSMISEIRAYLTDMLGPKRMQKIDQIMSPMHAWGSLGPHAPAGPEPPDGMFAKPGNSVRLEIPEDAAGSGTAEDPFVDVISGFLKQYDFRHHKIEEYYSTARNRGYPDRKDVSAYIQSLAYEPVRVILPAGHYHESLKRHDSPLTRQSEFRTGINVPPRIWLEAEERGKTVIQPAIDPKGERERGSLLHLHPRAGLIGCVLDGSTEPDFEPDERYINAVTAHHEAVIAQNEIRRFTNAGIRAAGSRGRAGAYVTVYDNLIEWVGGSGVRSQSRWIIQDNQIRYAGVLRSAGGGGDDGIIPGYADGGLILNNLVILSKRPHGRHVISGHVADNVLVAGNVSVVERREDGTGLRNNIFFSDGSHDNWFVGNLAVATGRGASPAIQSVGANGYGNIIEYNASINNPMGFRAMGREDQPLCYIRHNYAEYIRKGIHRSSQYEAYDNEMHRIQRPIPLINPEEYGFFQESSQPSSPPATRDTAAVRHVAPAAVGR